MNAGPGPLSFSVDTSSRSVSASLGAGDDVQWGSVTPVYGSIPALASVTFALIASSLLLPPGSFEATVIIHTNQPTMAHASVEKPVPFSEGYTFSIPWKLHVVEALAFPAEINVTVSPLLGVVSSTASVANFAGSNLVVAASTNVAWLASNNIVQVIPPGSVASFPIAMSYPLWDNGSFFNLGINLTTSLNIQCWRAVDSPDVGDATVSIEDLASLFNFSHSNLPNTPYFSRIPLNSIVVSVSTVVGPPNATMSAAQLLSPAVIPVNVGTGIRITLTMRDAGGFSVQPSDDVIGLVGLRVRREGDRSNAPNLDTPAAASVTSITPSSGNSSFVITAQPHSVGPLMLDVTLNGSLVGSSILLTVVIADCAANQTAENGLTCVCRVGYYYNDSSHCLPCPAGTYKPDPSNEGKTS